MNNLPIVLSIIPFFAFIYLIFVRKNTLLKSSFITLVLYLILGIFYWKILPEALYVSFGKGFFVAIDIFIIIFGAILFLEILKTRNIIKNISYYLSHISKDYRIQVIVIAWFLEALLEGTAGFGTPAAVAVPLLIGVGLSPVNSLIISLLGNSSPGIFGAAGTPIKIGVSTLPVSGVPYLAAILNMVGILVPVFMMWVVTRNRPNKNKEFVGMIPFALWSGLLFLGPSLLAARFLGQEFPTIVGAIVGLGLVLVSIKLKIFIPNEEIALSQEEDQKPTMSPLKSFLPYILLVLFLIVGKFTIGKINIPVGMGFSHNFNLFNPGIIFILVGIIVVFWKKIKISFQHIKTSFTGALTPFLTISFMLIMVQIMINAGINNSGHLSPIKLLASSIESNLIPLFAPFAGAFGSFMTGSVTTSNVLFGTLFHTSALNMGIGSSIILALLVVGAGLGNMIAMADILTAEAVIGEKNKERKIIKAVIVPCLICLFTVGLFGMLMVGWYN
jgi:lactate permease